MQRKEDWPERLIEAVTAHRVPFEWGVSDCWRLPADAVMAMTGEDPLPEVNGAYKSASGAGKILKKRDCDDVGELMASIFQEISVAQAGRGDIGVIDDPERGVAGVVFIDQVAIGKSETGLQRVPRASVIRAFKV